MLNILAGEEDYDSGTITFRRDLKVAYLEQDPKFPAGTTVLEACFLSDSPIIRAIADYERAVQRSGLQNDDDHTLQEAIAQMDRLDAWTYESRVKQILTRLNITAFDQQTENLSGGQTKRIALANALITEPDLLILDEPTNHLDNAMLSWLEDYLKNYRGTVFMVTHDRYFLDKVSNRILEISHGKMYSYDSNYSRFLELKAEREEMELASERKRQSILRMELEWAKRGCRARSTKQRARLERLEVLKNGTAPTADAVVEMDAVETRMGKKTIEFHNVSKAFGDKTLMKDFEYIFLRNQSVGIIGPNGCGKSTMLRMITGEVLPDAGTIEIGDTIRIGYLAQEEPDMDTNQRVIDYVKDIAEYVQTRDGRISASQMLERFLFILSQ